MEVEELEGCGVWWDLVDSVLCISLCRLLSELCVEWSALLGEESVVLELLRAPVCHHSAAGSAQDPHQFGFTRRLKRP